MKILETSTENEPGALARNEGPSPHSTADRGFRSDIQGLRAVAVLAVMAFHARLPVPGGYVGVDVFFVISGFVITAMLVREWSRTNTIRLGTFYARRFKRLTPALAFVVLATVLGSIRFLTPFGAQQNAARTGMGALLLMANRVIAKSTGGYFDAPAASNPLLHTWSLSVEEQFYLAFPLLVVLALRARRRWPRLHATPEIAVGVVAAVSLGLALVRPPSLQTLGESWLVGFYGPGSRAWEFAVGALLALRVDDLSRLRATTGSALGLLGGAMLATSFWLLSEATPVPGPWILLPTLATACLLVAGAGATNIVSRSLASRPLATIGDWSYSLYLWHWPFIVFATVRWPDRRWAVPIAAIVSIIPALASYRWVETPLRQSRSLKGLRLVTAMGLVSGTVVALSGEVLYAADHIWSPRLQAGDGKTVLHGDVAWKDHDYRFGGYQHCFDPDLRARFERSPIYQPRCQQSKQGPHIDLALLGDSHAEHLFIGLSEALPATNVMYFIIDGTPTRGDGNFAAAVDYVVKNPAIRTVIVTSFWARRGVNSTDLSDVLRTLVDAGKNTFVTDDVPDYAADPGGCKLGTTSCSIPAAQYAGVHRAVVEGLDTAMRAVPGVRMLETVRYFCDEKNCSMALGGDVLYADGSHLNVLGSRYIARRIVADYGVWLTEKPHVAAK